MNKFLISASGVAMAAAMATAAWATNVTDTYSEIASGQTIGATSMKSNLTNLKNAVNNLDGNLANGACTKNAGDDAGGMVRVGPLCVDKYLARATIGSCTGDGTTGCGSVVAVSTVTGSPAADFSFAQAVRACTNAGKRLLTPGEYMAAFISGALLETATDTLEFVDSMMTLRSTNPVTDPSSKGAATPAQGGYIGPRTASGGKIQMVNNVDYDLIDPDGSPNFLFFRCVR